MVLDQNKYPFPRAIACGDDHPRSRDDGARPGKRRAARGGNDRASVLLQRRIRRRGGRSSRGWLVGSANAARVPLETTNQAWPTYGIRSPTLRSPSRTSRQPPVLFQLNGGDCVLRRDRRFRLQIHRREHSWRRGEPGLGTWFPASRGDPIWTHLGLQLTATMRSGSTSLAICRCSMISWLST